VTVRLKLSAAICALPLLTVKLLVLVAVPPGVVTEIGPLVIVGVLFGPDAHAPNPADRPSMMIPTAAISATSARRTARRRSE
jgi:hypothetical protein